MDVAHPVLLKASQIVGLTKPGVSLLEYMLGEEKSFLWLVRPDGITPFELPRRKEIELLVLSVRRLLTEPSASQAVSAAELSKATDLLSNMLLGPVASRIGNDRLIVCLDGGINYLTFEALPDLAVGSGRTRRPPIGVTHAIVRVQSASVLSMMMEKPSQPVGRIPVMILADPVFESNDPRIRNVSGLSGPSDNHNSFGRLPQSSLEASDVARLFPAGSTRTAIGFDASRATLLGETASSAQILHIATHAVVNEVRPDWSGIALSSLTPAGRRRAGFVTLREVAGMNVRADLVVLSACSTAIG